MAFRKQKFDFSNKTGYHYFIAKYWQREKDAGVIMSFEEAKLKAAWNGLTAADREKYKQMAIEVGEDKVEMMINEIKECDAKREQFEKQKQKVINETIEEFFDFVMQEDFATRTFYIAHCNWYVMDSKKIFYPGELCIIKYSIQNEIEDKIILDLDCGPFPPGYSNQIHQRSADVNKLLIPPSPNALKYAAAKDKIEQQFFNGHNPKIMFALDDDDGNDLLAVKQTMTKIFEREFIIVPIERLFIKLYKKLGKTDTIDFKKVHEILKEPRSNSIACTYHFNLDAVTYCSKNHVYKFAMNMSDALFPKIVNNTELLDDNKDQMLQQQPTIAAPIEEEENKCENEENIPPSTFVANEKYETNNINHMPTTEEHEDQMLQQQPTVAETLKEDENKCENEENIPPSTSIVNEKYETNDIDHMPTTEELEEFDLEDLPF